MIRLAGCFLTICGCVGLGYWYRQQFFCRLYHLRLLISILNMIMSEVRYSKASLPECCRQISKRLEEPYQRSFLKIWEETQENCGESYHDIFQRNMQECLGQVPLGKEEKRLFLEVFGGFGFEESRMQLNSLEHCKEQLNGQLEGLRKEVGEKGRMAMGMGTLGGLLLIIILL